jgi:hypothetical protein
LNIRNTGDSRFKKQIVGTHIGGIDDDTCSAASAHPAAELAKMLPYAVPHHLPVTTSPPPQQQPALQPIAHPAHRGSQCEQRYLRARISSTLDARAAEEPKRAAYRNAATDAIGLLQL